MQANWRGVSAPTTVAANGTTGFPATTPDKPYLTDYLIRDQPRLSRRSSAGITLDFKLSRTDRISVSLQATKFDAQYNTARPHLRDHARAAGKFLHRLHARRPRHGRRHAQPANANDRDRRNASFTPSIIYRHDGPIWKAEAGVGLSMSKSKIYHMGKGQFGGT